MLKYLGFSLLLSAVLVFSFCTKEKEEPVPEPIIGMEVEDADADVTIDQKDKRIDVVFYAYRNLKEVLVTFRLVDGARMYIPYEKTTVYIDLSKEKEGTSVAARVDGQTVVYKVYATIEYALKGLQATVDSASARIAINRADSTIQVTFDQIVDLSQVRVAFSLSDAAVLEEPSSNPATMDLREPKRVRVSSEHGGAVAYSISGDIDLGFKVPEGWTQVKDGALPAYMKLYKTDSLGGIKTEAYALLGTKKAVFSVMSNGLDRLTTIPDFYRQDPTAVGLINGSSQNRLIVVDDRIVNAGEDTTYAVFGMTLKDKTPSYIVGDSKVQDGKAYVGTQPLTYAMAGQSILINNGIKAPVGDTTTLDARSSVGVTARGDLVLMVCSKFGESKGAKIAAIRDAMAAFDCTGAVNLEGGSAVCLYVDGRRLLPSTEGEEYYKPLGCVGVLK